MSKILMARPDEAGHNYPTQWDDQLVALPKRIMQTWKTNVLPAKWQASQNSIRKFMGDWEYVLMTDEDNRAFVSKHFPYFLTTYDSFPHNIQRADAIRYCYLYVHGGIYIDCDIELLADISPLFTHLAARGYYHDSKFTMPPGVWLVASANVSSVYTNAFMASTPRQPIWLRMIEHMMGHPGLYSIEKHLHIMYSTGPSALTQVVSRFGYPYYDLNPAQLNPYTLCEKVYNKEWALVRPLEGSSWVSPIGTCYQACYCNSGTVTIVVVGILAFFLILIAVWQTRRRRRLAARP